MTHRMKRFLNHSEAAYQAWLAVEQHVRSAGVPHATLELVKLRASQINGCAFCLDMHARDAREHGESEVRLWTLAGWREAPYYTPAERAALALTEAMTLLDAHGVPDEIWDEAAAHFEEAQLAALVVGIVQINTWNRVNVALRVPPMTKI
ncbi:alkyl hydroperoxide reductase AhpD [Actinorhabdospora filicis]|uniref:Alkyl hydroperoxide reductase AhpD n=1 Tax=Actinorhabdospora filicis TaxID=1785913 RepID=A0A9W6SNI6_9ACTN|nr:carboxymuconolactone decarboxylase family protein [Actinorhabdospora filicis]GLZ80155.1 alkyl hydroperoxide reductase AhpD [Actinorhabdospora filicis]